MLTEATNLLAANNRAFVFPVQASTVSMQNDVLWWIITGISIFFTVLIFVLTLWFCFRYRASKHPVAAPAGHNNVLEIGWTIVPAIIVFGIFIVGFVDYMNLATPPANALEIRVNGKTWAWNFEYAPRNGAPGISERLYVPVNTPVRLTLHSDDVIHSLYIPAFRVKKDVVPGRYNKMWFEATKTGEFDIYCTEYCGTYHSTMLAKVVVLTPEEYAAKLEEVYNIHDDTLPDGSKKPRDPALVGAQLYKARGCIACHSIDGAKNTGPTWKDLYGNKREFEDGGNVPAADEKYIIESIEYPKAHVVKGYPNNMPSYKGQLTPRDLNAIIAYMKTLSQYAPKSDLPVAAPATAPSK
jgi:cytochrome c oxidase subunit II